MGERVWSGSKILLEIVDQEGGVSDDPREDDTFKGHYPFSPLSYVFIVSFLTSGVLFLGHPLRSLSSGKITTI